MNVKVNILRNSILIFMALTGVVLAGCSKNDDPCPPYYYSRGYTTGQEVYNLDSGSHQLLLRVGENASGGLKNVWDDFSVSGIDLLVKGMHYDDDKMDKVNGYYWESAFQTRGEEDQWDLIDEVPSNGELVYKVVNWADIQISKSSDGVATLSLNIGENHSVTERGIKLTLQRKIGERDIQECDLYICQLPEGNENVTVVKTKYKDEIKECMASFDEECNYLFAIKEFEKYFYALNNKSGVESIVVDNDKILYYDLQDDGIQSILNKLNTPVSSSDLTSQQTPGCLSEENTRGNNPFSNMTSDELGFFALYDNDNFGGTNIHHGIKYLDGTYNLPALLPYNLNDKITSLALAYNGTNSEVCSVLTVWEDSDYNYGDKERKKHRMSFIATSSNRKLERVNLKNVPCLNSSSSWNDRISSISFHFGYVDRRLLDW